MRLKPVFASMVLLGLSSGAALAAAGTVGTSSPSVQARLDNMQSEINQMQQTINQNNGGTQAGGGTSLQNTLGTSSDWFRAISVSGLINADAVASSRTPEATASGWPPVSAFGHNSSTDLMLSNADLFIDAQVNDWTKAHIGLNYQSNDTQRLSDFDANDAPVVIQNIAGPILDEGYITLGNFTETPFYLRVGKQYVNFGNYDRYAMVPTFNQLLTETNETAATLGFVADGFYGSVYGFRGTPEWEDAGNTVNVNNFGANLGFMQHTSGYGFNIQASYLNNINDVLYINSSKIGAATFLNIYHDNQLAASYAGRAATPFYLHDGYLDRTSGLSLDVSGNMGMFDGYVHYVTTLGGLTLGGEGGANLFYTGNNALPDNATYWAQDLKENLHALNVGAGVTFDVIGHTSRFGLDYQRSWNAALVGLYGLPQERYEGTYNVEVSKNVNVGLDVYHDEDYNANAAYGGTGRSSTTGVLRLGVMFA